MSEAQKQSKGIHFPYKENKKRVHPENKTKQVSVYPQGTETWLKIKWQTKLRLCWLANYMVIEKNRTFTIWTHSPKVCDANKRSLKVKEYKIYSNPMFPFCKPWPNSGQAQQRKPNQRLALTGGLGICHHPHLLCIISHLSFASMTVNFNLELKLCSIVADTCALEFLPYTRALTYMRGA